MSKILAKTLKDAIREKRVVLGSRQVLNSIKSSNLVVCSNSGSVTMDSAIQAAEKEDVPVVRFDGNSRTLGKMCGLQFRVSTLSLRDASPATVQSVIKESGNNQTINESNV